MLHVGTNDPATWDNERPLRTIPLPSSFGVDALPVTNADFVAFISDGGYTNPTWWAADASWVDSQRLLRPHTFTADLAHVHCALGRVAMSVAARWPAQVTLMEARAFCRWRSARAGRPARVMTEAEFEALTAGQDYAAMAAAGNCGWKHWHMVPVGSSGAANATADGVAELVGNGWEWTDTPLEAHSGFVAGKRYKEYTTDFFDGCHFVLRGAGPCTDIGLCRQTFRNFFQDKYPYMTAKFRCVYD